MTKIAVLGTGANGSCAAADLTRAGLDVTLIDQWPAHVEAMRASGLRVVMREETLHVPVDAHHLCDVCTLDRTFDVVFLMMKAYDTRWAAEFIKPYLAEDGLLVGIQNAMTAGDIAEIVGVERTLGCVIELSSELFTPGEVQRNTPPARTWFGLGSLDPVTDERLDGVRGILSHVGKVSLTRDILSAKWMKLVVNTMCLAPNAILGTQINAAQLPGLREFALRAGAEALEAGQSLGYRIEPIFGLTPEDVAGSNQVLEKLLDKIYRDIGPGARDTIYQDFLKGRRSEVGLINGLVVAERAKRGLASPANAAIAEIGRRIERGSLKPDLANFALAQDLVAASDRS
jgi:2-dehydropantoate 2-reductase